MVRGLLFRQQFQALAFHFSFVLDSVLIPFVEQQMANIKCKHFALISLWHYQAFNPFIYLPWQLNHYHFV